MKDTPTVSIIIPTYNRGSMLIEAVISCFEQKDVHIEVIVVDDGSTDDSIQMLSAKFPLTRIFKQEHAGACKARNRGLREASGEFIKFLDSDDKLAPDILSEQVRALKASDADVLYGDFEMFGNLQAECVAGLPVRITGWVDDIVNALLGDWWCAPFCYLYRKEAIGTLAWKEELECLQDFDFILCFALKGKKFIYKPGITGYYRVHTGQITESSAYRYAVNRCKILEAIWEEMTHTGELTSQRKILLAHGFWTSARAFYRLGTRQQFHDTVRKVDILAPRFYPEFWGPLPVRFLTGILGIERAEKILYLRRIIMEKIL